jgi:hypothetical protein
MATGATAGARPARQARQRELGGLDTRDHGIGRPRHPPNPPDTTTDAQPPGAQASRAPAGVASTVQAGAPLAGALNRGRSRDGRQQELLLLSCAR